MSTCSFPLSRNCTFGTRLCRLRPRG
ncbi:hypothetical protein [Streptomyces sp. NPDC054765]